MSADPTCDYCDGEHLAYELESDRGPVVRCIPCLAIEQGQGAFSLPFDAFVDFEPTLPDETREDVRERREHQWLHARDWYRVLARIVQDDPLVKRDPEDFGTINEQARTFLINIMGEDAHYPPSEVAGAEVSVAQTTFADVGGDDGGD